MYVPLGHIASVLQVALAGRILIIIHYLLLYMTQRILIAIDESLPAMAALEHTIAHYSDTELTVLYVLGVNDADTNLRQRLLRREFDEQRVEAHETATRIFDNARIYADTYGTLLTTAVAYGFSTQQLVAYAETHNIDQIVIGTHRRTGVSRFLLGSVAEGVRRRASIPILTVPEPASPIQGQ